MENVNYSVPAIISGGIVNSKAINFVQPQYSPEVTNNTEFKGKVYVEVIIDEQGIVTTASYISGNPLLKMAVEAAAKQTKFSQTNLLGQNVKVKGIIVYNLAGN